MNMEENSLFHNRYRLEKLLGRGAYSEVWLTKDEKVGGSKVALKIFAPSTGLDEYGLDMFAREFSIVLGVSDANILKPLHYDSFERMPYLVLPYCKAGSVKNKIGKMKEEEAWNLISDVAKGLQSLHTMNPPIIHQDIKPDNIMISDSGHYLITDFGVSTHLHSTLRKSVGLSLDNGGTRAYMAPERFSRHKMPIMASDIYSLGSTIYELLSGETPFGEDGGLLQKSGADIPELEGDFSPKIKDLIDKCLSMNPWDRPTTEQLAEIASTSNNNNKHDIGRKTTPLDQLDTPSNIESMRTVVDKKNYYSIYIFAIALLGIILGCFLALKF